MLLVGMQNGPTVLVNSLVVSDKVKHTHHMTHSYIFLFTQFHSYVFAQEVKMYLYNNLYTDIYISFIHNSYKIGNNLSVHQLINE